MPLGVSHACAWVDRRRGQCSRRMKKADAACRQAVDQRRLVTTLGRCDA